MASRFKAVRAVGLTALLLLGGVATAAAQNEGDQIFTGPDDPRTRLGTRGANFLEIPIGAREVALAGAGTVSASGVNAMYWNPGAMALSEDFAVGFSYTELFSGSDITHFYGGAMLPVLSGVFGVSVNTLSSGDLLRTSEREPSGQIRTLGSSFDWTSTAVGGYYSQLITDRLGFGLGIKFIQEGINEANAEWVGADLGLRFETGLYGTVVGATIANLGGDSNFEGSAITEIIDDNDQILVTGRDISGQFETVPLELPTYFRFGFQIDLAGTPTSVISNDPRHGLSALIDIRDAVDTAAQPSFALEYAFDDLVFLRGGKFVRNEFVDREFSDGLAGGIGVNIPLGSRVLKVSYAYMGEGDLDNSQTFTVNFEN